MGQCESAKVAFRSFGSNRLTCFLMFVEIPKSPKKLKAPPCLYRRSQDLSVAFLNPNFVVE
jgi:hypothetical protein